MERNSDVSLTVEAVVVGGLMLALASCNPMGAVTSDTQTSPAKINLQTPVTSQVNGSYPTFDLGGGDSHEDLETMERAFRDPDTPVEVKRQVAFELVLASQDDGEYFEYLRQLTAGDIAFCAHIPPVFDASDAITEEFKTWASTHEMSEGEAVMLVTVTKTSDVVLFASLGDERAYPLLVDGLLSPNVFIRLAAAEGLAYIGNPAAISLIVAAAEGTHEKLGFARALAYFDDPLATAKTEEWVTDPAELQGVRDWVANKRSVRNQ